MSLKEIEREYLEERADISYRPAPVVDLAEWLDPLPHGLIDTDTRTDPRAAYWRKLLDGKLARRRAQRGSHVAQQDAGRALFQALVDEWKADILFESSVSQIVTHRAYQRIIGLGPDALPYILEELEREPRQWFWALAAITGQDPAEGETSVADAAAKWLEWARVQGIRRAAAD
jgi:hypothetical protein